ncbi:MAG: 50S ribosomal protein L25/general stress protein Ctc [Anaerolineales bacterium]
MEKIVIKATKRSVIGKQVSALRRAGQLPGVIYGHNVEPVAIQMDAHEAGLLIPRLTSSSIVTVDLEGKKIAALVREKQKNYIKGSLIHVDFQAVSLTEKIRAWVPVHLLGVAPAVKDFSAVLVHNMEEVEIEALPGDLPERIDLDISGLKQVGDSLHVRDLILPKNVEMLSDMNDGVVIATGTAAEESAVAAEAAAAVEPSLVEKKKKEEVED